MDEYLTALSIKLCAIDSNVTKYVDYSEYTERWVPYGGFSICNGFTKAFQKGSHDICFTLKVCISTGILTKWSDCVKSRKWSASGTYKDHEYLQKLSLGCGGLK